jgi:hypothetical protein
MGFFPNDGEVASYQKRGGFSKWMTLVFYFLDLASFWNLKPSLFLCNLIAFLCCLRIICASVCLLWLDGDDQ